MTAIAQAPSAFATQSGVTRELPKYFYTWMAGLCMIVAFAGFTPSYWARVATGSFTGAPIFHIHGLLFSFWTVFFVAQAALASRRVPTHDGRFPRQGEARFYPRPSHRLVTSDFSLVKCLLVAATESLQLEKKTYARDAQPSSQPDLCEKPRRLVSSLAE